MADEVNHAAELRKQIVDLTDYDQYAVDHYLAFSYYVSQRTAGRPAAVVAQETCQHFGHDAPRGLCLRCGLGADITRDAERKETSDRLTRRDEFLASRATQRR